LASILTMIAAIGESSKKSSQSWRRVSVVGESLETASSTSVPSESSSHNWWKKLVVGESLETAFSTSVQSESSSHSWKKKSVLGESLETASSTSVQSESSSQNCQRKIYTIYIESPIEYSRASKKAGKSLQHQKLVVTESVWLENPVFPSREIQCSHWTEFHSTRKEIDGVLNVVKSIWIGMICHSDSDQNEKKKTNMSGTWWWYEGV